MNSRKITLHHQKECFYGNVSRVIHWKHLANEYMKDHMFEVRRKILRLEITKTAMINHVFMKIPCYWYTLIEKKQNISIKITFSVCLTMWSRVPSRPHDIRLRKTSSMQSTRRDLHHTWVHRETNGKLSFYCYSARWITATSFTR